MHSQILAFFLWLSSGAQVAAQRIRASPTSQTFKSAIVADSGLTYVKNSGICETTRGVGQSSGYINIAQTASIWFWFFEARHSPQTAPLTVWLSGGPGCSSMLGLFQGMSINPKNGPCTVNPDGKTTTLNPYSWNTISNMIYIDQPVGAGFSTGSMTVTSTDAAAVMMWTALQILFESPQFSSFQSRDLILATESYGAHYGPAFITYFIAQNALIDSGALIGKKVIFKSLMINDGKHDPLIQYTSYITFAEDAPGYGPLQPASVISKMSDAFFQNDTGCRARLQACYAAGTTSADNALCAAANSLCVSHFIIGPMLISWSRLFKKHHDIFLPATQGRDSEDLLRSSSNITFPPLHYESYLKSDSVLAAIGATSAYVSCSEVVVSAFNSTGEFGRTALPPLAALADAHFPILIWVGDADIKANWLGVHESYAATNWTIDGVPVASMKTVDSFTFSRVFRRWTPLTSIRT
ncbi:Alpha/beta-hydrolase [Mycena sanguinolenta]|uniref:Alpha/beta-hydrolase n=1 Tax=Mycena sanguinolenta TaxID=230812 RepID=A0A8H6X509_9AGAR|nr:Alpha/beta-hydrolase [Mycena sanguinolenta]